MELHVGDGRVSANVVKAGHARLAPHLVDQLGLPEEHRVALVLRCFLLFTRKGTGLLERYESETYNFGGVELLRLLLLD